MLRDVGRALLAAVVACVLAWVTTASGQVVRPWPEPWPSETPDAWPDGTGGAKAFYGLICNGDYTTGSAAALPADSASRTIMFWVKPAVVNVNYAMIYWYGVAAAGEGFAITTGTGAAANKILVGKYAGNSGASTGTLTAGVWTHVAVTYTTGGAIAFYFNGVAAGTTTLAGVNTTATLSRIGEGTSWVTTGMNMRICMVGVWSGVKSRSFISSQMYNTNPNGAVLFHAMRKVSSTVVLDEGSGGNNATFAGMAAAPSYTTAADRQLPPEVF